jgi:hypothetical protein
MDDGCGGTQLNLASFPKVCIIFGDPLSQIGASEMIFSGRFNIETTG